MPDSRRIALARHVRLAAIAVLLLVALVAAGGSTRLVGLPAPARVPASRG
jgi:hypothetical protein